MFSKKFLVFILSIIILASFSFRAFAASGQGYFGPDNGDDYQLEEEDEDYEDEYEDDDNYVTVPPAPSENNYWEKRNITPEQRSVDAAKVIKSYQLDRNVARILLDKHRDAENTRIGKREQSQRYERIIRDYPYDYLAAYKAAELNYDMGRYSTALKLLEASLRIYPSYIPASRLRTKVQGAVNRNR